MLEGAEEREPRSHSLIAAFDRPRRSVAGGSYRLFMGLFSKKPSAPNQQATAEAELQARTLKFLMRELACRSYTEAGAYLEQPFKNDTKRLETFVSAWTHQATWQGVAHLKLEPSGEVGVWVGDVCLDHLTASAAALVLKKIDGPVPVRCEVQRIDSNRRDRFWGVVTLRQGK